MEKQEILTKFPFLKANPKSEWVNGNCPSDYWLDAAPEGWKDLVIEIFTKIRPILIKHHILRRIEIEQIKEKWGYLNIYFGIYPYPKRKKRLHKKILKREWKLYLRLHRIIRNEVTKSGRICIDCGKPATYKTKNYILPYCDNCIQKTNYYGEKLINKAIKL